jgi:hypothetical protein
MYGLPKGVDLSFFVGKRLDSVSFAEFVMFFNFDDNVTVTLGSSFLHQQSKDAESPKFDDRQSVPVKHSALMQLVGRSVVSATGDDEGTLTLCFDDGQRLSFFEDRCPYESYTFSDGEHEYIV